MEKVVWPQQLETVPVISLRYLNHLSPSITMWVGRVLWWKVTCWWLCTKYGLVYSVTDKRYFPLNFHWTHTHTHTGTHTQWGYPFLYSTDPAHDQNKLWLENRMAGRHSGLSPCILYQCVCVCVRVCRCSVCSSSVRGLPHYRGSQQEVWANCFSSSLSSPQPVSS